MKALHDPPEFHVTSPDLALRKKINGAQTKIKKTKKNAPKRTQNKKHKKKQKCPKKDQNRPFLTPTKKPKIVGWQKSYF